MQWAFEVDPTDHCETPEAAYVDICPCLDKIAEALGKNRSSLAIYDPFFCKGSMGRVSLTLVQQLGRLGFQNVYNKNEDFYQVQAAGQVPDYDVFITNPPYSGDHVEKLLKFVVTTGKKKPWFLLMPNYVYRKPYYTAILKARGVQPILISPNQRYQYLSPLTGATSPFVSFWYVGGLAGPHKLTLSWLRNRANRDNKKKKRRGTNALGFNVALQPSQLPMNMKDSNDPTRTRLRKNQRDAKKKKLQAPAVEVKKGSSSLESSNDESESDL